MLLLWAGLAAPSLVLAQTASDKGHWRESQQMRENMERQDDVANGKSGRRYANLTDAERRQIGYEYAACLVGKYPKLTQEYVLQTVEREKADTYFRPLSDFDCIPEYYKEELTILRMGGMGGRYNMAEALLKTEQPEMPENFTDLPYLEHLDPAKAVENGSSKKRSTKENAATLQRLTAESAMSRIGECTVRGDMTNAKALLETKIGSAEEMAIVQNLVPLVSRCITSGSIRILPEHLRGSIALNLYRLIAAKADMKKVQPNA